MALPGGLALGVAVGEDAAAGAVRDWSASAGTVDGDVLAVVDRSGVDVVLATNATSRLAEDLERVGLHDRFRHVVNSSDIGAAKPDEDFFAAALAVADVSAAEAVFVDDSEANVRAAAAMGIRSHRFAGVPGLRRFLDEVVIDPHDGS